MTGSGDAFRSFLDRSAPCSVGWNEGPGRSTAWLICLLVLLGPVCFPEEECVGRCYPAAQ